MMIRKTKMMMKTKKSSSPSSSNLIMIRMMLLLCMCRTLTLVVVEGRQVQGSTTLTQQIQMLGGQYVAQTDVQSLLDLALDAAAMKETTNFDAKLSIYQNGRNNNNNNNGGGGNNDDNIITLQSLSLNAKERMDENPIYQIYKHAFLQLGEYNEGETEGIFDTKPISQYADTVVQDLFSLQVQNIETDAALVMNVWMAVISELFQVLMECKGQNYSKGIQALDKAAALWIGTNQEPGDNYGGHMLYAFTEQAGERFDQDDGETLANTEIISLFRTMQLKLLDGSCGNTPSGYIATRENIKTMLKWMSLPLIQSLIHHIKNIQNENKSDFVELYSLATIPRVAACNPTLYNKELNLNVLRELTVSYQEEALSAVLQSLYCYDISCEELGIYKDEDPTSCSNEQTTTTNLAGYTTSRELARDNSYLDRDILQIDIFLKFNSYGSAVDWYEYGWNGLFSLQELAKNLVVPLPSSGGSQENESWFTIFTNYNDNDINFADTYIMNVLQQIPPYNNASTSQTRQLILGTLKYTVLTLSCVASLQFAIDQCSYGSNFDSAQSYWDDGVAFYVGSMNNGNGDSGNGINMYSTSNELCIEFGTCVGSNDNPTSAVNDVIMKAFQDGITSLNSQLCDVAQTQLQDVILPNMIVPLIQGTIKYASYNANLIPGTQDSSLAIGDAFARAVLPLIDNVSISSSQIIRLQMGFQLTSQPVPQGFTSVADAFRQALPLMSTDCNSIGRFEDEPFDGNLCNDDDGGGDGGDPPVAVAPNLPPVPAPVQSTGPTQPEDIAFGRYQFTNLNVADGDGSFSLDVRDMFNTDDIQVATDIYRNGANADTLDLSLSSTGLVSLASLSKDAATYMGQDPMFNIYKYALYKDEDLDDISGQDFLYADDLIEEALQNGQDNQLAAEGAVIINVWMLITSRLHKAVEECENQNMGVLDFLDSAVALWIGKEQGEGLYDHGWMLYSVGQSSAKFYGLPEGEAPVNTEIMNLFIDAKANAQTCVSDSDAYIQLRQNVLDLYQALSKPLIFQLLFHMVQNSRNMVELYSVSVIPQSAACDPHAQAVLQPTLFQGYNKDQSLTDELVGHMATFLRCQRITCDDLQYTSEADPGLINLIDRICTKLDYYNDDENQLPMAGYVPQSDVREVARLSLDVLEIEIFTKTQAYKAAMDMYIHGHNSIDKEFENKLLTLKDLTRNSNRGLAPQFKLYSDYLGTPDYADGIVSSILDLTGDYAVATRGQRADLAVRAIQTLVSFMSILGHMHSAKKHCDASELTDAQIDWDKAVALYVGSIAGFVAGGADDGDGNLLYSLANEVCSDFDTCEGSGEAESNERILHGFAGGREALANEQCEQVTRQIENEIFPRMVVPLIQGTIKFADSSIQDPDSVGSAHMIAKAVIPLINSVNATSAMTLDQEFGSFITTSPGTDDRIFEAFGYSLRGLSISCDDLGNVAGLCQGADGDNGGGDEVVAPLPDTPTNLGDDLYVTTTYVQDRANIAMDLKEMRNSLDAGVSGKELAELIYRNGQNSEIYDDNGKFVAFRSLKKFSVEATLEMQDDPLFNFYMYALQDNDGTFMSKEARLYADTLVTDAFGKVSSTEKSLPIEAAVALNLWMYNAHLLQKTLDACKRGEIRDDDGVHSMDIAVAYWIGDGQVAGDSDRGHLLYALAEEMGDHFGTIGAVGEAKANTKILRLFNEAKNEISLPGACSDNPGTYVRLRYVVNKLVPQMAVPLIQGLIHNLRMNDFARVKIYATAVVPLFAGCSPSTFSKLKDKLIYGNYNVVEVEDIVALLGSAYSCLGLQCDDIGVHTMAEQADEAPACDIEILRPLAGYTPASDVREYARMDLDLRHLDVLLQMNAYEAATDLYVHGKHVTGANGGSLSLSHLATTSERSIAPSFDAFARYYDNDAYADNIIRAALSGSESSWNDAQRRLVVLKSAQVMVMYFGALEAMYSAVSDCESFASVKSFGKSDSWDRGAAYLIGSLEGRRTNGTAEGYMFYELAQEHCDFFGTCSDGNSIVEVNDQLMSLLYTGRGEVLGNSCSALRKATDEIAVLLLIPQIQGALRSSILLSNSNDPDHLLHKAAGFVYSRALLPLVDDADREAATTIDSQLGLPGPRSTKNTAAEVFSSFAEVYPHMDVDCELIGETADFDACTGVNYRMDKTTIFIISGVCFGLCLCFSCVIFLRSRKKQQSKLPENNPKFIEPQGEFNNHSMDLLEKAFSSNQSSTPRTQDSGETIALTEDLYTDDSDPAPFEDEDDFEEATALKSQMESTPDII